MTKIAKQIKEGDVVITEQGERRKVLSNTNGMMRFHRHLEFRGGEWSEVPANAEIEVVETAE